MSRQSLLLRPLGLILRGTTRRTERGVSQSTGYLAPQVGLDATVITSASLGQAGSGNTAVVNGSGVMITTGTGTKNQRTGEGIFIAGTTAADIKGQGQGWDQFSFHIDSSDVTHGVIDHGTATYNGTGGHQGMLDTLNSMTAGGHGPWQYKFEDYYNFFHLGEHNMRFSTGADPRDVNYGPSPHFPVPSSGTSVPGFHVDSLTGSQHLNCAVRGLACY
jgi:hypothetical protein